MDPRAKALEDKIQIPDIRPANKFKAWWVREWHNLRVFLGLATDWTNPDNAAPSLEPGAKPHAYIQMPDLQCCPRCGGGKNHPVHQISKQERNTNADETQEFPAQKEPEAEKPVTLQKLV